VKTKLFIQIPCFNEEDNLPSVLMTIPKRIEGIDSISILIIDDGSTDTTSKIAMDLGVEHLIRFPSNRGLSAAFQSGIDYALAHGATHIVNTDADNQYSSIEIEKLVSQLFKESADIVIGDRNPGTVQEFHYIKRFFQVLGSKVTSSLCGVNILDATSGFRVYTAEAAAAIHITNPYTYTLESLIQLSFLRYKIDHVLVTKNPSTRPSRLFKSPFQYIRKNGLVLLKSYIQFAPMKFFGTISGVFSIIGLLCFMPFASDAIRGNSQGHLQSLIVGTLFLLASLQTISIAFLGDSIRSSRLIIQKSLQNEKLNRLRSESSLDN
jgi:glycosyltransferase involved in cell wall biosynthesis